MSLQGTWADALIIQAVAEALNVSIHITESNEGFAPLTVVAPIHRGNNTSTIILVMLTNFTMCQLHHYIQIEVVIQRAIIFKIKSINNLFCLCITSKVYKLTTVMVGQVKTSQPHHPM